MPPHTLPLTAHLQPPRRLSALHIPPHIPLLPIPPLPRDYFLVYTVIISLEGTSVFSGYYMMPYFCWLLLRAVRMDIGHCGKLFLDAGALLTSLREPGVTGIMRPWVETIVGIGEKSGALVGLIWILVDKLDMCIFGTFALWMLLVCF
ncbi:hypothetical protein BDW72DRAFT_189647 [Aspergillus terricola var. indicus]